MPRVVPPDLLALLERQDGVASWTECSARLGERALAWRVACGDWQAPARGVVVAHNGPLSPDQKLWVDVVAAGNRAVLAGLTAAELAGLKGFPDERGRRWVLVPHGRQVTAPPPGLVVRSTRVLPAADVRAGRPPRTSPARSLVDAAAWGHSDRMAEALLLAGAQQRLVRPADLARVLAGRRVIRRRRAMARAITEAVGGAQTLPELEFVRLCRRNGLPMPTRQSHRRERSGAVRWLDAEWRAYGLVVEIDGRGHMDLRQWWADMLRDAHLVVDGLRVLRFPSFVVREQPDFVAGLVGSALRLGGWEVRVPA